MMLRRRPLKKQLDEHGPNLLLVSMALNLERVLNLQSFQSLDLKCQETSSHLLLPVFKVLQFYLRQWTHRLHLKNPKPIANANRSEIGGIWALKTILNFFLPCT